MPLIDIAEVRADTPGCRDLIHFNNAGSSMPPRPVVEAQSAYLRLEARMGGYEAQTASASELDSVYEATAEYLSCGTDEIAYTGSASEAWWRAFLSIPLEAGDRVLIGSAEFTSGGLGLIQAQRRGVSVEVVPDHPDGGIDLEMLASMLDDGVKLVALTHLPMSNGLVNPAAEVGRLAKSVGALYLLDSCQAVGQMPLDVDDLQCDFLTATGRKWLRGPRGTGFLFVRRSALDHLIDPPFIDNRSANWHAPDAYALSPGAQRFEFGETSFAAKLGLGAAVRYMLDVGIHEIHERVQSLAIRLRSGLEAIGSVSVHDVGVDKSGIVTFTVDGLTAAAVSDALRLQGINTSAPGARNTRIMMDHASLDAVVRAAPHYYNTEAEVDEVCRAVTDLRD